MASPVAAPAEPSKPSPKLDNGAATNGTNGETEDAEETPVYCAALPNQHGHSLYNFLRHGQTTRVDATFPSDLAKQSWQQVVSMLCVKLLWRSYTPMKLMGLATEWTLNFLALNHGIFVLLFRLLFFRWRTDPLHCPHCFRIVPRSSSGWLKSHGVTIVGVVLALKLDWLRYVQTILCGLIRATTTTRAASGTWILAPSFYSTHPLKPGLIANKPTCWSSPTRMWALAIRPTCASWRRSSPTRIRPSWSEW
jgi:hypothetical protein